MALNTFIFYIGDFHISHYVSVQPLGKQFEWEHDLWNKKKSGFKFQLHHCVTTGNLLNPFEAQFLSCKLRIMIHTYQDHYEDEMR